MREGEGERDALVSAHPPRSVSSSEFSQAAQTGRSSLVGGGLEEEEEDGVKGDGRGRRVESRGQRFVMEVQDFRG